MSDDLISRKALLDRFRYGDKESESDKAWICAVRRMIKEQPTAFNKEKVIEELQKHSHNYYPSIDHYCLSRKAVDLKDAIEIVEKGEIE